MIPEALFLAGVLLVGVLSGGTAAVVGFGIGSLLTPLLLTRLEPHEAVAAVAIPHLLATAVRLVRQRPAVDRHVFAAFGLPSAAASLAGAFLLGRLTSPLLGERVLLGLRPERYRQAIGAAVALVGALLIVRAMV